MPYEAVAHGKLEGLDYHAARPFMNWRRPDLLAKIKEWVALNPPRLELATLAFEELKERGANRAKPALRLFPERPPSDSLVGRRTAGGARGPSAFDYASRQEAALRDPA